MMGLGGAEGGGLPLGRAFVAILDVNEMRREASDVYGFYSSCPWVEMYI